MIATLKDYYKSQSQNLPSLKDRAKIYESLGLGAASTYQGSLNQNTSLLSRLQKPASSPAPKPIVPTTVQPAPVQPAPVATPAPQPETYSSLFDKVKKSTGLEDILNTIKTALTTQPKKADLYTEELNKTGVQKDQTDLADLDTRLATIDSSLGQSEKDVRDRINKSGGIVTESQVQRLVASEKAPLVDEYRSLSAARGSLADRIAKSEARATNAANLRYSDASQPLESAKANLNLVNPVFNQTLSAAEKDLTARLNKESTATKASTDQDKTMAGKGYQYVNTPAQRDQLKKEGYDIMTLNGRTYAKQGVLSTYEAKKQIDAKLKKTTSGKAATTKNYSNTNIPANLKNEIVTNAQAGATREELIKAYPEVSSNTIDSLMPKKSGRSL